MVEPRGGGGAEQGAEGGAQDTGRGAEEAVAHGESVGVSGPSRVVAGRFFLHFGAPLVPRLVPQQKGRAGLPRPTCDFDGGR